MTFQVIQVSDQHFQVVEYGWLFHNYCWLRVVFSWLLLRYTNPTRQPRIVCWFRGKPGNLWALLWAQPKPQARCAAPATAPLPADHQRHR